MTSVSTPPVPVVPIAVAGVWIRTTLDILLRAPAEHLDLTVRDASHALRLLRRNPFFTATAVITLALAIGVNTTVFAIVDGILFRPLPYHEPDRIVMVTAFTAGSDRPTAFVPKAIAVALNEHRGGLGALAAVRSALPMTLLSQAGSEAFTATGVTTNLLQVLGVRPVRGRTLTEADVTSTEQSALLSHAAWTTRFGADPSAIGRVLDFAEGRVRIVGVLPKGFVIPSLDARAVDLMLPFESPFQGTDLGREIVISPIARLEPDVTLSAAQTEIDALAGSLIEQNPGLLGPSGREQRVRLVELQAGLFGSRRSVPLILFAAASLVLLIACVNLASLLLSRAAGREREMAVRSTLGASRLRLIRQLAVESSVLAVAGGIAGLFLARWSFDFVVARVPPVFMLLLPDTLDGRAVAFSALATALSIFFFGAVPALRNSQTDLLSGLQQRGHARLSSGLSQGRLLIAMESVLLTLLVVAAMLMAGSFRHLQTVALGFDADNLMSITLSNRPVVSARMDHIIRQVASEVRDLPGIVSFAAEDSNPIGIVGWQSESARLPTGEGAMAAHRVSTDYFSTMALLPIAGRLPTADEWRSESNVAVITKHAAHSFGGPEVSLGRTLELMRGRRHATIIGVVRDLRLRYDDVEPRRMVFVPPPPDRWVMPGLIVRTRADAQNVEPQIRAILAQVMPRAVPAMMPVHAQLDGSLALPRFQAQLLGAFAVLALLLAIVGIHGVAAQAVAGRTREIGIRMALGATPGSVRRLVIIQGVAPVVGGLILGAAASFWTVQLFRGYVHGVQLHDPIFFVMGAFVITATAFLSTWIPARCAARIDPAATLRTE